MRGGENHQKTRYPPGRPCTLSIGFEQKYRNLYRLPPGTLAVRTLLLPAVNCYEYPSWPQGMALGGFGNRTVSSSSCQDKPSGCRLMQGTFAMSADQAASHIKRCWGTADERAHVMNTALLAIIAAFEQVLDSCTVGLPPRLLALYGFRIQRSNTCNQEDFANPDALD